MTPGGTPVPSTPAPGDASPTLGRNPGGALKPEEPARHVTELPPLSEPKHRSQGAVLAGDWIVAITPSMIQLSASAQEWWTANVRDARAHYVRWLEKTPQERLKIRAEHLPKRWLTGKFVLVEQRGISLLMKALPETFRDQLVSRRLLHTSAILFQIYCKWQPGGALEKGQLLEFLVTPDPASTAAEAAEGIRKWQRMCRRGHELDTVLPDPSLLLRGLDVLTGQFLQGYNLVSFRVAAYRNDTGVDYAPTSTNVAELAEFLLAECETLAIADRRNALRRHEPKQTLIPLLVTRQRPLPRPPQPLRQLRQPLLRAEIGEQLRVVKGGPTVVFIMINRFLRVPGGVGTVLRRITSSQPALTCLRSRPLMNSTRNRRSPRQSLMNQGEVRARQGGRAEVDPRQRRRQRYARRSPQIRRNQLQPPLHSPSLLPGPLLRRNSSKNAQIWFGPLSLRRSGLL